MRPDPHSPSDERVLAATGRSWFDWFALLDERGAAETDHKGIVAIVREAGGANAWWQQAVTVGFEKARGLRSVVGETADAGFQVGVRRTVDVPAAVAWAYLVEGHGRERWLGATAALPSEKGATYRLDDGTSGEIRSTRPGRRLRLTLQRPGEAAATTLQLTIQAKDDRSIVALHHERLPDEEARATMKAHWTGVLDALQRAFADGRAGTVGPRADESDTGDVG